jgi:2-phosphosulfolactate phosphatase
VIIDVYRAFTTAAYVMGNGAERIIPITSVDKAFQLRKAHPSWILMGENHGYKIPGFEYGNSPVEVENIDFTGRTIVQRTSSGTQGISLASNADEILLGSFVIAKALTRYIIKRNTSTVSLVAMGWEGLTPTIEDELCADYLEAIIKGENPDFERIRREILADPNSTKFSILGQNSFNPRDPELSLSLNRFDFAIKVMKDKLPFYSKIL